MLLSSANMIFLIFSIFSIFFSKYQPLLLYYLLTFLIHAYLTQTAKNIEENFNPLGRAQQRRRRQTQTDGNAIMRT